MRIEEKTIHPTSPLMRPDDRSISSCRNCRFYRSEGRRGGQCNKLNVPVQGSWDACRLSAHPFAANWRGLEELMSLPSSVDLQEVTLSSIQANAALRSTRLPVANL
ncbi:MAG: hypothetical protein KME15_18385 [Drouetiella hepatica Uher 2000/2452]|uniref:Uncharacterized protein n=1 Tax=Drouetiella hepatica Uher 2000/2452 TaxID=904376 RepID=A0A951QF37_9CYAN|nr:hypothetical protein [Drouetiella hepatica Uher 2000/2452]